MEGDSETRSTFLRQIYGFVGNLAELRDFVDVTSNLLKERDREDVAKNPEAYVHFLLGGAEELPQDVKLEDEFKRAVARKFADRFEIVEVERAGGEKDIELRSKPGQSFDVSKVAEHIGRAIKRQISLRRSALISLISACEWFAAQMLHFFLDRHPGAANLGDRSLSFDDLKTFDSVDDARKWLVANRIEDILRGSFEDWLAFFVDKLKIDKAGIEEHIAYCQEACLRRNVLVHNGGVVNKIYCKRLPAQITDRPKEGDEARVDENYLDDRLDRFQIVFVLVALEVWRKLDQRDELRLDVAVQLSFDALKEKRWPIAKAIGAYVASQKRVPEATQLMAKVNYWQSFKWSGELEEIRQEVEQWDVSAKGGSYQVAKHVLLDADEEAIAKLKVLIATGELKADNLREWPLFQGLRDRNALEDLLTPSEDVGAEKNPAGLVSAPPPPSAESPRP